MYLLFYGMLACCTGFIGRGLACLRQTGNEVQGFRLPRATETAFRTQNIKKLGYIIALLLLNYGLTTQSNNYINIQALNFKALAYLPIFEDL